MLAVIGANRRFADRARAAGISCLFISSREDLDPSLAKECVSLLVVDPRRPGQVVSALCALHQAFDFQRCLSLAEYGLEIAALVNQSLGIPASPWTAVHVARRKDLMRERLGYLPCNAVDFFVAHDAPELSTLLSTTGGPLIVKPLDGVGSRDVVRAEEISETKVAFPVLVETFVPGRIIAIDAISRDGVHHLLGVTEEFPNIDEDGYGSFAAARWCVPPPNMPVSIEDLFQTTCEVLARLGVTDGPSHTEFRVTDTKTVLLEVNTRFGDMIPELIELASGLDVYDIEFRWVSGQTLDFAPPTFSRCAMLHIAQPPSGWFLGAAGLAQAKAIDGIEHIELEIEPGELWPSLDCASDRRAFIIATGSSAGDALERCMRAEALMKIETNPDLL